MYWLYILCLQWSLLRVATRLIKSVYSFTLVVLGYGPRISRTCFIIMAAENQSERREYAKFKGTNFPQWRFGVMLKLRSKKLEKIVLGTETKPAEVINYLNCYYIFNHPLRRWPKKPAVVILSHWMWSTLSLHTLWEWERDRKTDIERNKIRLKDKTYLCSKEYENVLDN